MSRLRDGCGALSLGGVGVNWGLQARGGGGESRGGCLRGDVDGAAVLRDERGSGVTHGFGLVPFYVEGFEPSCLTKCAQ